MAGRLDSKRPAWKHNVPICGTILLASRVMKQQSPPVAVDPGQMRQAMAGYIDALHRAYLDAAAPLTPGERGRLPLVRAGSFTVAAVGARSLHVVGTTDPLPAPVGPEVVLDGQAGELRWQVRFFDPVVLPALGLLDDAGPDAGPDANLRVRDLLGLSTVVYHLTVPPGGGLTAHHALHAGTGLAHTHAAAARDYDALNHLLPHHRPLLAEMRAAEAALLGAATLLLARAIAPDDAELAGWDPRTTSAEQSRRRLLAVARERG